jgi:hypothetical protein
MAASKKPAQEAEISITTLIEGEMTFCILGTSPLIFNRLPEKAWRELLMPQKKTAADRNGNLKHDPIEEFRNSPYRMKEPNAPTVLAVLPMMFKQSMGTAALRTPGAKKTEIEQLVRVDWANMPIFGIPKVFCAITRSADMNRTPDVRTRAILPEWACTFKVRFQKPILKEQVIADILATAGRVSGICDWRQEKGSGSFGSFNLVSADNADFKRIVKTGGRKAQEEALANPEPYDDDTSELLAWFDVELKRRGFDIDVERKKKQSLLKVAA